MQTKNKKAQTTAEREYVGRIKEMSCAVCEAPGPSDAHEIEQGLWWLSVPLCRDCHMGSHNGIHGRKAMWNVKRKTELSVLNEVIAKVAG